MKREEKKIREKITVTNYTDTEFSHEQENK